MEWNCTRAALTDLEKLLTCGLCKNFLTDPCTLENCDHNFCRKCIEKKLGNDSKCPDCGVFSWLKDLRSNNQLSTTVTMMLKLRLLIGSNKEVNMECDSDITPPENTIIFDSLAGGDMLESCTLAEKTATMPMETNNSLPKLSGRIQKVKENIPKIKDVALVKVIVELEGKINEPVKKYLLRRKLKRPAYCFNDNSPDMIANDFVDSNERSQNCRSNGISSKYIVGNEHVEDSSRQSKDKDISNNDIRKSSKGSNTNSPFTCLQARLNSSDEKEKTSQKQSNDEDMLDKAVNTPDNNGKVSSILEEKENITLNVKRRRVRRRDTSIKQYLVEMKSLDSTSEILTHFSPQRFKKSTMNASVSPSQDVRNKRGETPLHLAAIKVVSFRHFMTFRVNDLDHADCRDRATVRLGDVASALELIKEGANPNAKDNAGWTPLHEACNHGHVKVVELFLGHGALLNIPGFDNDTPLHDAVANGRLNVVKLLIKRGASLTARNKQGLIPMDYASSQTMKNALSSRAPTQSGRKNLTSIDNINLKKSEDYSKVIVGTALSKREREILEKCVLRLGGTYVHEFSDSVTHVVTSANESGLCPRTMKYFSGVLTGKWIVCFKWIADCTRTREWCSEDFYEVHGTSPNGPKKARDNMAQQLPPLFEGCSFFLRGSFCPPTPNKQDLINLIKLGGGHILQREPKMKDDDLASLPSTAIVTSLTRPPEVAYHARANSSLSCCTQFIIYDPTFYKNPKVIYFPVLCTAPVTWLMDCISSFELLDIPDDS